MDFVSECSALESVEDNEVNQEAIPSGDISRIRTNGTCSNDAEQSSAAESASDGSIHAASMGKDLSVNSPPKVPSPIIKGRGLKKWKRIPRDFVKDTNSSEDTSKILKRALSTNGNPIKPRLSPTENKQNNDGSVGSTTPFRNIGNVDALTFHGSSSNSRFAMGSAFNPGADSENSEDRSSKSSTAASAPKIRYDPNTVFGHVREKNRIKSNNGKSIGGSGQKGHQGMGSVEGSKKARGGGRIKVEKENSQSSIESDSRSSRFVFRQGNLAAASNGNGIDRFVTDDGDNSDGAYAVDQQFSEEVETAYRKEDELEAEDVTQDNLAADLSWEVKEEKDRNHWSPWNKDSMDESILSLQSAQHALEKEIKKLAEIGECNIPFSSTINDAGLSSFVYDNLETHKSRNGKAAPSSSEATVVGLTGKVKVLENKLGETMVILKSKESRVAELESSISSSQLPKEEEANKKAMEQEELERFFRQRLEAEIEYLVIVRTIDKLQCETIIDGKKQQVLADEQVEMMNRLVEAEKKATTLKKRAEGLEKYCGDVLEAKEDLTSRGEVFKVSSCAFVQLILLILVLRLFVLQIPSSPSVLVVPT